MTSLFREILTMSLSAGFLVGIIIGFRWCFRRVPKWVHCILWGLVAVRLLFPSLPESHLSMVPEKVSDSEAIVEIVRELPRPAPVEQAALPKPVAPAEGAPEKAYAPAALEEVPVQEATPSPAPIPWMTILTWIWVAGMAAMGLYAFLSTRKILKLVEPSVHIGGGVYLCDYIDTPFLLGFRKPRIYMPSYLDTQTADFVLSHERSHIRRRDHWWKPIGFVLLSIHWFNPMIWVGYILLCRDIEMACDEAVIHAMDEDGKKGYSTALLTCSLPRSTVSICPLAFGEVSVKERIRSVLNYRKPALWLSLVGIAAVVLGAVFFLTNPKGKIPLEDVEYYVTASYGAEQDQVITTEYDKEFRVSREVLYEKGEEIIRYEHSYKRQGNKLTHTVACTRTDARPNRSFSLDIVDLPSGQTVTLVYEETLAENDNVLESVLSADGEWQCTRTFTYDENGNLIHQIMDALERTSYIGERRTQTITFSYDDQGNMLSKASVNEASYGTSSYLETWEWDEDGNCLHHQLFDDDKLMFDDQFTLDVRGKAKTLVSTNPDGTSVTYHSLWDGENLGREAVTMVDQNGAQLDTTINFYDDRDNKISTYNVDDITTLHDAFNYIGTDGFKSTGIPEEIYTEGKSVHANPEPYVLEEDVPYYPTAKYEQDSDTLTVYDYDEEFTLKRKTTYVGGYEKGQIQYKFNTVPEEKGDITTMEAPLYSLGNLIYHQVNSKGQITQSICYRYNQWHSTHRYSYDAFGKLECVEGASPQRTWKIFYTPEKLMNKCCHLWIRDVAVEGPAISETDFPINDRTEKMLLPDILEETGLYSHETDEIILAQEPIQYGAYGFDHNYGKINLNATLDGKLVFGQSNTLDSKGNVLNSNLGDGTGNHITYFNYISRDGHESRGISEKIYPANFQAKKKASYPSARYDSETGLLTKYEYDKNYQLTGASVWKDGEKISESDYRYKTKGNALTITETKTENGQKTELVYTKELDENGRVVKSTLYRDGVWDSTYLFKNFPSGGINVVVGYNGKLGFRLLADQMSHKIRYRTGAFTETDVPSEPVWLESPEMQAGISEKWYLPGMINDKLYFHELGGYLEKLGERHDDQYSWNGGGSGSADGSGNKSANVQIRRWEDSSLAEGQTIYMTLDDHPLWKEIYDNEWCAFNNNIYTYYNYINTDGTKIAGIPEDLYYDAAGEWLASYSYTPQEKSGKTMDYVELDTSKFWFDPSIPREARQDCISATNRINNAIWGNYTLGVCVLGDEDLDRPYIVGSTLYTTVQDFRSREYAADVICAANGEFTLYGLAYGYANFLCDKLGWQEAESTEFVMPQNVEAADLNALCFDERYSSQEDIAAAKQLACWFANAFLLREDKNNYHIRFWMSNDPKDMREYVCNELAEYYAEMGLDYRPTQVLYARGGDGYTANAAGEIIPVNQSAAKDYAGVRAYFEEKLPRDLKQP